MALKKKCRVQQSWVHTNRFIEIKIFHSKESQFPGSKKGGNQVPTLDLQLSHAIVPSIDFNFLGKICTYFHVEGGPNFCHVMVFANVVGT